MQSRLRGTIEAVAIKNLQELLRKKGITAEALFTKYDIDANGFIDNSEFKAALESITGQQAPDAILSAIFGAVDINMDGTLNLEEIMALLDGGPTEAVSEGSSVEIRDHPNDHYNGLYEVQSAKINGKSWYMNSAGARLYFYNANSGGAPSWSLDDREQDGSNDWYRGGWSRPKSDNSLPTGVRRWVGVGKISVTPSDSQSSDTGAHDSPDLRDYTTRSNIAEEDPESGDVTTVEDISPEGGNDFENFSDGIQSTIASLEDDVIGGRITVEQAREMADAEVEKQIDKLPFMLKSPAKSLWQANAERMQIELTSKLAEKSGAIATGAAFAGTVAGVAAVSGMQEASPTEQTSETMQSPAEEDSEYSSHDDWHEEHHVDVPDRVEVESQIEIPEQVDVNTEVEIPEYEDPDDWYRTTKVRAGSRVSVPDRVTVGSRRQSSFSSAMPFKEVAVAEPVTPKQTESPTSELSSLSEVAAAFAEARMLSDQRELANSLEGKNFDFEIKVTSDPERTFGIGIEDAYRKGVTILGEVSGVGEVEVRLTSEANSGSMSKGSRATISASVSSWNSIRKRLVVNAQ